MMRPVLGIKEDIHNEFKSSFQDKVIETLVAFANTSGGTVYIGVGDDGTVHGIELENETFPKWLNEIKAKTEPSVIPTIEKHEINGRVYASIRV